MQILSTVFIAFQTAGLNLVGKIQSLSIMSELQSEIITAFLAGAILPAIALYTWTTSQQKNQQRRPNDNKSNAGEDDNDDDESDCFDTSSTPIDELACQDWGLTHAPYKMVLVVNSSLSMGKGKIAAQCGHAAVGCYKQALKYCPAGVRAWEYTGCAKIAVKCPMELDELLAAALAQQIPHYLVEDAGRTQIAAGSQTVLGIFGPVAVFENLTSHLKLM